jgi:hypothetical protein
MVGESSAPRDTSARGLVCRMAGGDERAFRLPAPDHETEILAYGTRDGKLLTRAIEYAVAYHCNLRCAHCSHLSPFQAARFPPVESFRRDLTRLREALHTEVIRLLGGEPLLNPQLDDYLQVAKESGIADRVMVTTNGLLLHRTSEAFWSHVDLVLVSLYPGIGVAKRLEEARRRARAHGTELWVHPMPRFRTTALTSPQPDDWVTAAVFASCENAHVDHCHMLHEGHLYRCPMPPFLPEYLAQLGDRSYDPAKDGLDIHAAADLRAEVEAFLTGSEVPRSCRYCLGHVGKVEPQRQLDADSLADPHRLEIGRDSHLDPDLLRRALFSLVPRRS